MWVICKGNVHFIFVCPSLSFSLALQLYLYPGSNYICKRVEKYIHLNRMIELHASRIVWKKCDSISAMATPYYLIHVISEMKHYMCDKIRHISGGHRKKCLRRYSSRKKCFNKDVNVLWHIKIKIKSPLHQWIYVHMDCPNIGLMGTIVLLGNTDISISRMSSVDRFVRNWLVTDMNA